MNANENGEMFSLENDFDIVLYIHIAINVCRLRAFANVNNPFPHRQHRCDACLGCITAFSLVNMPQVHVARLRAQIFQKFQLECSSSILLVIGCESLR